MYVCILYSHVRLDADAWLALLRYLVNLVHMNVHVEWPCSWAEAFLVAARCRAGMGAARWLLGLWLAGQQRVLMESMGTKPCSLVMKSMEHVA